MDYQVTCITLSPPEKKHEHITHIGCTSLNAKFTKSAAIKRIESKTDTFHVIDSKNGKTAYVDVVKTGPGAPYLRTYADGDWKDNLLSLPDCPTFYPEITS
jgi:hypothetical protein